MAQWSLTVNGDRSPPDSLPFLSVSSSANFFVAVTVSGNPGSTNSSVSVMSFSKTEGGTLIASRHTWHRTLAGKTAQIPNNSNYNFCSIKDLEAVVDLTITPIEEGFYGEFYLKYGPVKLDPEVAQRFEQLRKQKVYPLPVQGEFSFSPGRVDMVELTPRAVTGLDVQMQTVAELPVSSDLLVITVPNNNKRIKVFNSEKKELALTFRIEEEKDLFMLLLEHWKGKLAAEQKELGQSQGNARLNGGPLFGDLEHIENRQTLSFQRLPTDVIEAHAEQSMNNSLGALTDLLGVEEARAGKATDQKREQEERKEEDEAGSGAQSPSFNVQRLRISNDRLTFTQQIKQQLLSQHELPEAAVKEEVPETLPAVTGQSSPFQKKQAEQTLVAKENGNVFQRRITEQNEQPRQQQPVQPPVQDPSIRSVFRTVKLLRPEEMSKYDPKLKHQSSLPTNAVPTHQPTEIHKQSLLQPRFHADASSHTFGVIRRPTLERLAPQQTLHQSTLLPSAKQSIPHLLSPSKPRNELSIITTKSQVMRASEVLPKVTTLGNKIVDNIVGENESLAEQNRHIRERNQELQSRISELEFELQNVKFEANLKFHSVSIPGPVRAIESQLVSDLEKKKAELAAKEHELQTHLTAIGKEAEARKTVALQLVEARFNAGRLEKEAEKLRATTEDLTGKLRAAETLAQSVNKEWEERLKRAADEAGVKLQKAVDLQRKSEAEKASLDQIVIGLMQQMRDKDNQISELKKRAESAKEEAIRQAALQSQKHDSLNSAPMSVKDSKSVSVMDKYDGLSARYDDVKKLLKERELQLKEATNQNRLLAAELITLKRRSGENRPVGERALSEQVNSLLFDKSQLESELNLLTTMLRQYERDAADYKAQRDALDIAKQNSELNAKSQLIKLQDELKTANIRLLENEQKTASKELFLMQLKTDLTQILEDLQSYNVHVKVNKMSELGRELAEELGKGAKLSGFSTHERQAESYIVDLNAHAESINAESKEELRIAKSRILELETQKMDLLQKVAELTRKVEALQVIAEHAQKQPVAAQVTSDVLTSQVHAVPIEPPGEKKAEAQPASPIHHSVDNLTKRLSFRSAEEEFFSLNEDIGEVLAQSDTDALRPSVSTNMPTIDEFINEVIAIMLPKSDTVRTRSPLEKVQFIRGNLKKLIRNWIEAKKAIKAQRNKIEAVNDENELLRLKLEDVKKRRHELVEFVKTRILNKEKNELGVKQ